MQSWEARASASVGRHDSGLSLIQELQRKGGVWKSFVVEMAFAQTEMALSKVNMGQVPEVSVSRCMSRTCS